MTGRIKRQQFLLFALLERGRHDRPDVLGIQAGYPGRTDPSCHNGNNPRIFGGWPVRWDLVASDGRDTPSDD
jgi:hypothetical protein